MKKIIILVGCLFAFNAFSVDTKVCKSIHRQHPAITLHLDELGIFQKVVWQNEVAFEVNPTEDDHVQYSDVTDQLNNYPLALHLQKYAIGANTKFSSVVATVNTTKRGHPPTFASQMDIISDDAAGILLLEFKGKRGQNLGSAILVGWGGIFKNCR